MLEFAQQRDSLVREAGPADVQLLKSVHATDGAQRLVRQGRMARTVDPEVLETVERRQSGEGCVAERAMGQDQVLQVREGGHGG